MVCAPVRRDNPRALARGLSIVQTLHITEYLAIKIGYLWIVVQEDLTYLSNFESV